MRSFDIVVAADAKLGIANGGDLPWHLPGDLAHFKNITTRTGAADRRNAVIMGRKTWESVAQRYRPLSGRLNVVLSRRPELELPDGVLHARSMEAALELLATGEYADRIETVFCVGGGVIYGLAVAMAQCERIYITRVHRTYECDTRFPAFEHCFELESVMSDGEDGGVSYQIQVWRRAGG